MCLELPNGIKILCHENVRQLKKSERMNLTDYNIKILSDKYKGQV